MSSWKVRLLLVLTMLAMLVAVSMPAMANDWEDVDVDVVHVGPHVDCFVITFEEEDHDDDDNHHHDWDDDDDEEEEVDIVCFREPSIFDD